MTDKEFEIKAKEFINDPIYKQVPYSSRNWGHEWHSLCSYQGKLKPAIAFSLIESFTKKGDLVLDPLSGVGTIPFEASLNGRIGIGNDLSELAYAVTYSKLKKPNYESVLLILEDLNEYIEQNKRNITSYSDLPYYDWGFNGKLGEYYHLDTFQEIILAREYFLINKKIYNRNSSFTFVLSATMHVLHGNRPYALSRNSHPLTPYKPSGDFIYKNLVTHVKNKIDKSYRKVDFSNFVEGDSFNMDYTLLSEKVSNVDWIITSPPFTNSIKFYINNWLRLWFAGWEPDTFKDADNKFLDGLQEESLSIYTDFFRTMSILLKDDGKMILHLGKTKKTDMAKELAEYSKEYFDVIFSGDEDVSNLDKHGIKDKGATFIHQYLFLRKKK